MKATESAVSTGPEPTTFAANNPAFLIGVTGHMDLDPKQISTLEDRVKLLFRFLKSTPKAANRVQLLEQLVQALAPDNATAQKMYAAALQPWCGLPNTPVIVLSSLAPGADSLVARVASEKEFKELGFSIQAPLPFPHDLYPEASTFVCKSADGTLDRDSEDNRKRKVDYAELVADIGGESQTFPVRLNRDRKLVAEPGRLVETHHQECQKERDDPDPAARRERYRAAGEYIAAHAHLLIAIWDQEDDNKTDAGTAAIVEARRTCLKPGVLPASNALGLPHGGPLVHLTTKRLKNTRPSAVAGPPLRFLHTYDSAPPSARPGETTLDDDPRWQRQAIALFCRIAANLDNFNKRTAPNDQAADGELNARLTRTKDKQNPETLTCALHEKHREFHDALRRLAGLRRRAANDNRTFDSASQRTLKRLFRFTLIAAAMVHLFAHWHTRHTSHASTTVNSRNSDKSSGAIGNQPQTDAAESSTEETEAVPNIIGHEHKTDEDGHELRAKYKEPREWIRMILGLTALGFASAALIVFWRRKPRFDEEHAHDCRALAEGLRVQFYWNLAGLGESVPANYMQRQRSELDWIRGVIRWSSFPYELWRTWFDKLSPETKIAAIECARCAWVVDQVDYFQKTFDKHRHSLHFWHKLGWTLAISGLWTFLILMLCACPFCPSEWLEKYWLLPPSAALLLTALLAWATVYRARPVEEKAADKSKESEIGFWTTIEWSLNRFVATHEEQTLRADSSEQRSREMLANFVAYLLPSATLSAALLTVSTSLGLSSMLPDAFNFAIILGGWCLLSGAMSVAWAEKNLFSELAYQYSTMKALFRSADHRLAALLNQLRARQANAAEFAQTMSEIHGLLFALGKEALDENAEWLILHRARPLEPVMAG